jgi:hypothetical protein
MSALGAPFPTKTPDTVANAPPTAEVTVENTPTAPDVYRSVLVTLPRYCHSFVKRTTVEKMPTAPLVTVPTTPPTSVAVAVGSVPSVAVIVSGCGVMYTPPLTPQTWPWAQQAGVPWRSAQ